MIAHLPVALFGLVLMGGGSRRMGYDKALLKYHQEQQWQHCFSLLKNECEEVFFSCKQQPNFIAELCILDEPGDSFGPVTGIISAMKAYPSVAWLVLAIDMPLLDAGVLRKLVQARDQTQQATLLVGPTGKCEPLCAIYEPAILPLLSDLKAQGPRFILENCALVKRVILAKSDFLQKVKTAKERKDFFVAQT